MRFQKLRTRNSLPRPKCIQEPGVWESPVASFVQVFGTEDDEVGAATGRGALCLACLASPRLASVFGGIAVSPRASLIRSWFPSSSGSLLDSWQRSPLSPLALAAKDEGRSALFYRLRAWRLPGSNRPASPCERKLQLRAEALDAAGGTVLVGKDL